jgi:hypothetical protein
MDMNTPEQPPLSQGESHVSITPLHPQSNTEQSFLQSVFERKSPSGHHHAPHEGTTTITDSQTGSVQLEVGHYAELTSSQVQESTGIVAPVVNRLRQEGLLFAWRPPDARSKRDGYLYRSSDIPMLIDAKRLNIGKTFMDHVRTARNRPVIDDCVYRLLDALCAIKAGEDKPIDSDQLMGSLRATLLQFDVLDVDERDILIKTLEGQFPESDDSAESLRNRRLQERAYAKVGETLFVYARFRAIDHAESHNKP